MLYRSTLFAVPVSLLIVWIGLTGSHAIVSMIGVAAGILIEAGLLPRDFSAGVKGTVIATALSAIFGFMIGSFAVFGTSNLIQRANQTVVTLALAVMGVALTVIAGGFSLLMAGNVQGLLPDMAWLACFLVAIAIAPRRQRPQQTSEEGDDDFDPATCAAREVSEARRLSNIRDSDRPG